MKKSLLALAVLGAFAGAAQAQSAVTIYGSFDGGVRHVTDVNAAGDSRTTMGSTGTFNSNRLGFRGVEDLGGGLKARFTLEAGFNTGTGGLDTPTAAGAPSVLFNRTAAVGLGGNWGFIDLGRQYTNAFLTIAAYDPFVYKFPGIAQAVPATAGVRYNNDIKYTGTFGPVTARAEYALGEVAGSVRTGSARSISANYSSGPIAAGAAYTLRDVAGFDNDHWTVGGAYKFGPARVSIGYANEQQDVAVGADTETKFAWVGLNYAITPAIELTYAYYRNRRDAAAAAAEGEKDLHMLAATYALSKRTNLYAEFDTAKNEGVFRAAPNQSRQRGISIGVNHLF
ncbi:MAG TPA: porin [Noviherbaspirillum sp.]|uniref:porin n=1 Tax=Noviherbaspirillum sp. TaxID=1926288 RepID=UPI002DDDBAB3|nr:porin [Noviherbaspirillum sp.]HEV2612451.1 porin [Noviherbaspirillum sp.]